MNQNQFNRRFQSFRVPQSELDRMWRREMEFQEELRMMAEAQSQNSLTSSGGPGGSPSPQSSTNPLPPLVYGLSSLLFWEDATTGTWKFLVHDYQSNTTSAEYDTGLSYTDFSSYSNDEIVEQGGYMLSFADFTNSLRTVFFVTALGEVVQRVDGNFLISDSFRQFEFIVTTYYYDTGTSTELYIFDGTNVQNHSFPAGVSISYNTSGGEVTSGRSISLRVDDGVTVKTYIAVTDGSLVDVTETAGNPSSYSWRTALQQDFMVCLKTNPLSVFYSELVIFDQLGTVKNTFDLSGYGFDTTYYNNPYGNNMYAVVFYDSSNPSVDYLVLKYDSTLDTFYTMAQERGAYTDVGSYFDFRETVDDFPNDLPNLIFYFQDSSGFATWGQTNFYSSIIWSIGSGGLNKYQLADNVQTEFYFNSALFADVPVLPYAPVGSTGNIGMAVLGPNGITLTTSGQSNATCTGMNTYSLGEVTMVTFNAAPNSRFEFWSDTLLATETISDNWSVNANGGSVLVYDNNTPSDSFWYTTGTGSPTTISTLTSLGTASNMYYGTLTGIEEGYLVFWEANAQGQPYDFAYILGEGEGLVGPLTGLNTANGEIDLGQTTFAWRYVDPSTNEIVLNQFLNSDGSTISQIETGTAGLTNYSVYGDRVLANVDNSGVWTVFLQGTGGQSTLTITSSNLRFSHNDAYWAD